MRRPKSSAMNDTDDVSIKAYLDTRLNLLNTAVTSCSTMQTDRINGVRDELIAIIAANDVRYRERFDAQSKALDFAATAAKEAVTTALAGTKEAALKTEQTADKRFADLGDLIREQFKGMGEKFDGVTLRVKSAEDRLNTTDGEARGGQHGKDERRSSWHIVIGVIGVILSFLGTLLFIMSLLRK
jgi:membrane-bound ClpP family serine protease